MIFVIPVAALFLSLRQLTVKRLSRHILAPLCAAPVFHVPLDGSPPS
ncbi:MAG: hypothetical protein ACLS9Z_07725 [Christensenellaceae bacterium]|jgi:hypothetical protein